MPSTSATFSVNTVSSTKHLRLNENSSTLWHTRLGHISRQRMERLIMNEILPNLDFSYSDTFVDCIKCKLTAKVRNVKVDKCTELLRVIHTDIYGPFTPPAMGNHKYFIKFNDDYSCYGFIELIREKPDSLEAFKAFKAKVELQQGKKINVVHSDRGGATLDHLRSTFKNVALMLSIQCLVLLNIMGSRRGRITHFLIWRDVCMLIPHYLSSYGVKI